jgi:hypothetical protein
LSDWRRWVRSPPPTLEPNARALSRYSFGIEQFVGEGGFHRISRHARRIDVPTRSDDNPIQHHGDAGDAADESPTHAQTSSIACTAAGQLHHALSHDGDLDRPLPEHWFVAQRAQYRALRAGERVSARREASAPLSRVDSSSSSSKSSSSS